MTGISAEDRAILTTVIGSCPTDPNHQYRAPDGTTILLLNPDEEDYTFLRASDGVLLLPRYRLQRKNQEEVFALN